MATNVRDVWTRRIKVFFLVACGGPLLWLLTPALFNEEESIWLSLTLVVFMLAPILMYAAVIYRRVPVVVFGALLAAHEAWSLWHALTGESSTSSLAIFSIPLLGIPLVLLGWVIQTWWRSDP